VAVVTTLGCPYCKKTKVALQVCAGDLPVCDGLHSTQFTCHTPEQRPPNSPDMAFCSSRPATSYLPSTCISCCLQAAGIPYSEYELSEQLEVRGSDTPHPVTCVLGMQPALKFALPC
jgi:glutaredoxin